MIRSIDIAQSTYVDMSKFVEFQEPQTPLITPRTVKLFQYVPRRQSRINTRNIFTSIFVPLTMLAGAITSCSEAPPPRVNPNRIPPAAAAHNAGSINPNETPQKKETIIPRFKINPLLYPGLYDRLNIKENDADKEATINKFFEDKMKTFIKIINIQLDQDLLQRLFIEVEGKSGMHGFVVRITDGQNDYVLNGPGNYGVLKELPPNAASEFGKGGTGNAVSSDYEDVYFPVYYIDEKPIDNTPKIQFDATGVRKEFQARLAEWRQLNYPTLVKWIEDRANPDETYKLNERQFGNDLYRTLVITHSGSTISIPVSEDGKIIDVINR